MSYNATDNAVKFQGIDKLGPDKEIILGILVKVKGPEPKLATCRSPSLTTTCPTATN